MWRTVKMPENEENHLKNLKKWLKLYETCEILAKMLCFSKILVQTIGLMGDLSAKDAYGQPPDLPDFGENSDFFYQI